MEQLDMVSRAAAQAHRLPPHGGLVQHILSGMPQCINTCSVPPGTPEKTLLVWL